MILKYRTDLASEALGAEKLSSPFPGLEWREESIFGLKALGVSISGDEASKRLGKAKGTYHTLYLDEDFQRRGENFPAGVKAVAELIGRSLEGRHPESCLIAALGNPDITPDALGPLCASNILVTRHLKEQGIGYFNSFASVALCRTGVLGTTGLESARQIKLLCRELKPELVIAVDALAGSEAQWLCRSVQISSSGIAPGSGVKNDRMELSAQALGVPVVAIGVPTVIDAGSISSEEGLGDMFVTPRGIDSQVRSCARLIGYGINLALHRGLSIEDVDMLLG